MASRLCRGLLLLCVCAAVHVRAQPRRTVLYVRPSGQWKNSTLEQSGIYLSISDAIARASEIATLSDVSVTIRLLPGTHTLLKPLHFGSEIAKWPFSKNLPLIIESSDSEQVAVVSGGVELSQWKVGASPWLWTSQLPQGADPKNISSLWVNGFRRSVAHTETIQYVDSKADRIILRPNSLPISLSSSPRLRAIIFHYWTASYHGVKSVSSDGLTVILRNNQSMAYQGNPTASGKRVYFEGHPAFLRENAGTFVVDEVARTVTYSPTAQERSAYTPSNFTATAPQLLEIVRDNGVHGIVLRHVNFSFASADFKACLSGACDAQSASFLETAALHFEESSDIMLSHVGVNHVDGNGIWVGSGNRNFVLDRLFVTDVGAGGVRIGPAIRGVSGDARADNISLTNSVIEDGGNIFLMGCGVLAQAVSNTTISHNNIRHFHYTGVSLGWTWNYATTSNGDNEISFNHISEIGLGTLSDMGCVYHLGMDFGTKIANNICHNVSSFGYGGWGYYTDQASRGVTIENNIAYDTKCAAFHQHYGIDNVLNNNVFAFVNDGRCDAAIRSSAHNRPGDEGDISSFTFTHNIVYLQVGSLVDFDRTNVLVQDTVVIIFSPQRHQSSYSWLPSPRPSHHRSRSHSYRHRHQNHRHRKQPLLLVL